MRHGWPIKKIHCQFANQNERKFEMHSGNLLSLLRSQNKDLGAASQMLLMVVKLCL